MYNRRRSKRRRMSFSKHRARLNLTPVLLILCLSVACGYAAAKYVVEPVVSYVPQLVAEKFGENAVRSQNREQTGQNKENTDSTGKPKAENSKKSTNSGGTDTAGRVIEDDISVKTDGEISGYAVQYGCYSDKAAAENAKMSLCMDGLRVIKQDDMYKIVGRAYTSKDDARAALEASDTKEKAFVAAIYR